METIKGHKGDIASVEHARHEHGNVAVTCSGEDGTCRSWDLRVSNNKGASWCLTKLAGITHALPVSQDALYACDEKGRVLRLDTRRVASIVNDAATTQLWCANGSSPESAEVMNQVDVSSDGATVVSCDDNGCVFAFEASTGAIIGHPKGPIHSSLATSVAVRSGTSEVVTGGTDCAVRLWRYGPQSGTLKSCVVETPSQQVDTSTMCNPPHVHHVCCHPTGRIAAAALGDGRCLLYDLKERKVGAYLSGVHSYSLAHSSFPTQSTLITAGNDRLCALWSITPRKCKTSTVMHRWPLLDGKPNWASSNERHMLVAMERSVVELMIPQ
jgi:WD40 repeat protein